MVNLISARLAVRMPSGWILAAAAFAMTAQASSIRVYVQGTGLAANTQIDSPSAAQHVIFDQTYGAVSTTDPYGFTDLLLDVTPGILRFDYSAAGGNPNPTLFAGGGVSGEFAAISNDTVFVSGGPASGFLSLQVKMDGTIGLNALPNLQPGQPQEAISKLYLDLTVGSSRVLSIRDETTNGVLADDIGRIATVLIPFTGSSVGIGELLDAFYSCGGTRLESCTATGTFGNTFQLGGAVILDSSGQVVSGAHLTSQTGYDYSQGLALAPVATPEPATWLLAAFPIMMLFMRKWKAGKRARCEPANPSRP